MFFASVLDFSCAAAPGAERSSCSTRTSTRCSFRMFREPLHRLLPARYQDEIGALLREQSRELQAKSARGPSHERPFASYAVHLRLLGSANEIVGSRIASRLEQSGCASA
jgi:hypothetical protein